MGDSVELKSSSLRETTRIGTALGGAARKGDCVALIGDLGAGKTHLVQAIARGLEIPDDLRVTSPTFTLVNIYQGGRMPLIHADLYRLEREIELTELGLDDWIGDALVCVEWADRFPALPQDTLEISIEVTSEATRRLEMKAPGPEAQALLNRFVAKLAS